VYLEDPGAKTIHPAVASGSEASNTAADYDDGFFEHGKPQR